jgi:hypothetical protein
MVMIFRLAAAKILLIFLLLLVLINPAAAADSDLSSPASISQSMAAPPPPSEAVQIPRTSGPIVTDMAITQPVNTWFAQITPTLNLVGGVFNSSWKRRKTGGNQPTQQQQLAARGYYKSLQITNELYYGLTPRADVSILIPVVQNWASDVGPARQAANFSSLGDSSITCRYMFLNGSPTATTVTGYYNVQFPTGHACPLEPKLLKIDQTGLGAYTFTWGLDIFKYISPVLLYANVFYTNFTDATVNQTRMYYPDQITGNLAIEVPFKNSPDNKFAFLLEILSTWSAGKMIGHPVNQPSMAIVSALPALEYLPCKWLSLAAGVQVPICGKNTQYSYSPTMALFINF